MTGDVREYRNKLEQLKGQRKAAQVVLEQIKGNIKKHRRSLRNSEDAQNIIQIVAQQTQEQLEYHINELVTLAMAAVFDNPYELKLEFVIRRGKTEAEIHFLRDGSIVDPMSASGGGPVDVASFALRVALWSLAPSPTRGTIVLDEPFRFLSRDLQPAAGRMLKMLSERLGLQFIMVTHNPDLIEAADKVYTVDMKQGKSIVQEEGKV
jgi:DNA repair exonuclease SbcCD ATPase subunit